MSNYVTIARPYAKAIFEHAKACEKLKEWSMALNYWALVVSDRNAIDFLTNPATLADQKVALFTGLVPEGLAQSELSALTNFITLLANNNRIVSLPAISTLFNQMRAEQEKTLEVDVVSFSLLTDEQEAALINKLKHRLKREIALNVSIDQDLLGGAIIQAGDLVIDGSVRGELNKLRAHLVA
jgi:F-type H+-transporting ATPase subunit delta